MDKQTPVFLDEFAYTHRRSTVICIITMANENVFVICHKNASTMITFVSYDVVFRCVFHLPINFLMGREGWNRQLLTLICGIINSFCAIYVLVSENCNWNLFYTRFLLMFYTFDLFLCLIQINTNLIQSLN